MAKASKRRWIGDAIEHPGALHRKLDVPEGTKIPAKKLAAARAGDYGSLAEKEAQLADTLAGLRKRKHK